MEDFKSNYFELIRVMLESKTDIALTESNMLESSSQNSSGAPRKQRKNIFKRLFGGITGITAISQKGSRSWHYPGNSKYNTIPCARTERIELRKREVESMEELLRSMYLQLKEKMAQMVTSANFCYRQLNLPLLHQDTIKNSKSFCGRLYLWFIYLLTVYLIWKVIVVRITSHLAAKHPSTTTNTLSLKTIANLAIGRGQSGDALSPALNLINKKLNIEIDLALWSLRLSFIMVGIIILSNLHGLVLEFSRVNIPKSLLR